MNNSLEAQNNTHTHTNTHTQTLVLHRYQYRYPDEDSYRYRYPKSIPIPSLRFIPIPISEKSHRYQKLYQSRYSLDSVIVILILYRYHTDIIGVPYRY